MGTLGKKFPNVDKLGRDVGGSPASWNRVLCAIVSEDGTVARIIGSSIARCTIYPFSLISHIQSSGLPPVCLRNDHQSCRIRSVGEGQLSPYLQELSTIVNSLRNAILSKSMPGTSFIRAVSFSSELLSTVSPLVISHLVPGDLFPSLMYESSV